MGASTRRTIATGWTALLVLLAATASAAQPAPDGWSDLPLPGGRTVLLPALGMSPDLPRALVVTELVRVLHPGPQPDPAAARLLQQFLEAPPDGEPERVPVPLDPDSLRRLLGREVPDDRLLIAVLRDRRTALLCYGLASMDAGTRTALQASPALLDRVRDRHAAVFAAFGAAIAIRDGRLQLPGGSEFAAAWEQLLGAPLGDVERALDTLLGKDDGRFAYFVEAASRIWEPDLRLVLGLDLSPAAASRAAQDVYRIFASTERGWRPRDYPFQRAPADPALLLTMVSAVDAPSRRTQRFWSALLNRNDLPERIPDEWRLLGVGPPPEIAWLLQTLTRGTVPERQARAQVFAFATRTSTWLPDARETLWASEAFERHPALLLVLERMQIRDFDVLRRLVVRAAGLRLSNDALSEIRLALFQAPIALVDHLLRVRSLSQAAAEGVLGALAELDPSSARYGQDIDGWLRQHLLPAAGYDPAVGALAEAVLLESLAGLGAPPQAALSQPVFWEGHHYRLDTAAPELQRLTEVRRRQGGNTLDTVLALGRAGRALEAAADLDAVRDAEAALSAVVEVLEPIEFGERRGNLPPVPIQGLVGEALRDTRRITTESRVHEAAAIAERLRPARSAALADVLTSLVYALYLGDPDGTIFLAGNVARRHDYGLALRIPAERARAPWTLAVETSGGGNPWHMAGSLLALDIGLGRFTLRRTRMDLPERQPTLVDVDRQAFVTTLVLTDPAALAQQEGNRLATWITRGRALASTSAVIDRVDELGLEGARREAAVWAAAHAPDEAADLLLMTELLLLGRDREDSLSDAWGAASTALTGALRLELPFPPALERYMGRAGSGLLPTRLPDLKLRVVELLVQYELPVALTRAVLAAAMQDALDHTRPAHLDDWHALARGARTLAEDRFEDYVAALTAGGPLIPATAPSGAVEQ